MFIKKNIDTRESHQTSRREAKIQPLLRVLMSGSAAP